MTARKAWLIAIGVVVVLGAVGWFAMRSETVALGLLDRTVASNLTSDALAELPDGIHVLVCGAGGPLTDIARSGSCVAVQAGRHLYVVDAGTNGGRNIGRFGVNVGRVEAVLVTHAHSESHRRARGIGRVALGGRRPRRTPTRSWSARGLRCRRGIQPRIHRRRRVSRGPSRRGRGSGERRWFAGLSVSAARERRTRDRARIRRRRSYKRVPGFPPAGEPSGRLPHRLSRPRRRRERRHRQVRQPDPSTPKASTCCCTRRSPAP